MHKRNLYKVLLCLFLILTGYFWLGPIYAINFTNFYFVGDSLTDVNNEPGSPNSNGDELWSKVLAGNFGKDLQGSKNGGTNYSYSGATSGIDKPGKPSALTQINSMITDHQGCLDSNALYSVWIGGNDFIDDYLSPIPIEELINKLTQTTVVAPNNIAMGLISLHNAYAKYIIAMNLPSLANSPIGRVVDPYVRNLFDVFNKVYNSNLLKKINALPFDVIQIDVAGMFVDLINHPAKYGFTNVTGFCEGGETCKGYLFWDWIHPTEAGHAIIADFVTQILRAPGYYATLAESPTSIIPSQNNIVTAQLVQQQAQNTTTSKARLFFNGSYAPNIKNPVSDERTNYKMDNNNVTIGVMYAAIEKMLFGAAFSYTTSDTKLQHNTFNYDTTASTISLFANYHFPVWYINGIANYEYLDFKNIKRLTLMTTGDYVCGSTDGNQLGLELNGGYMLLRRNDWKTGPLAKVLYQHIDVNGYSEYRANLPDAEKLVFGDQKTEYLTTGIGWQVGFTRPFDFALVVVHVFATGNMQWTDSTRMINFHVLSLPGSHGSLPAVAPGRVLYISTGVSLSTVLKKHVTLSVGYTGNYGNYHLNQNLFNIGVALS